MTCLLSATKGPTLRKTCRYTNNRWFFYCIKLFYCIQLQIRLCLFSVRLLVEKIPLIILCVPQKKKKNTSERQARARMLARVCNVILQQTRAASGQARLRARTMEPYMRAHASRTRLISRAT